MTASGLINCCMINVHYLDVEVHVFKDRRQIRRGNGFQHLITFIVLVA